MIAPRFARQAVPHGVARTSENVLAFLTKNHARVFHTSEICDRLLLSDYQVWAALSKMVKTGRVTRVKNGFYQSVAKPKCEPLAPAPVRDSFIRPLPLSRLMGQRA